MRPEKLVSYIPDPYQTIKFVIKKNINTPKLILKKEFKIDTLASMNVPIKTHMDKEKYIMGMLA